MASAWMLLAILTGSNRAWEIALGWDYLLNALTGGRPGELVSSRANRARREKRRWGCILCSWLDSVDPGHCQDAEHDFLRGKRP